MSDEPKSRCCGKGIRYVEIINPMREGKGPQNTFVFWCNKCGSLIDGKGNVSKLNITTLS